MKLMMDNTDYDLFLITEVERHPVLYNSNHANFRSSQLKQKIWREIAQSLWQNTDEYSVKMVRSRWKSLRDTLVKESRYRRNKTAKPKKRWRYSDAMAFLIPYLGNPNPAKGRRLKKTVSKDELVEPLESFLITEENIKEIIADSGESTDNNHQEDEIDTFFRGIADTVKQLTVENQVKVQKEIMNIVLDSKLWVIQETKDPSDNS